MNISLFNLLKAYQEYATADMHTSLPGRVVQYDPKTQEASVQPLIKKRYYDSNVSTVEDYPVINSVPVIFPSAAGGIISFPIKAGDIVLLIFCEQSLDRFNFSSGDEIVDPDDYRKFHLSDAVAIPGLYPFQKALGSHEEDMVVRFNVGTANENSVALKPNGDIVINTPTKVIVNASGDVEVNAANVNITAALTNIDGDISVTGNIDCDGTVTGTTDVVGGGISVKTHIHSGVTSGGATSGPPV